LGHSLAPIGGLKRSEKLLRETNGDSKLLADPHKHGLIGLQKFQRKKKSISAEFGKVQQ
jgi:hypothetical protein